MTKRELFNLLIDVSDDDEILVDGFEGGFSDIKVKFNIETGLLTEEFLSSTKGDYRSVDDFYNACFEDGTIKSRVVLSRDSSF